MMCRTVLVIHEPLLCGYLRFLKPRCEAAFTDACILLGTQDVVWKELMRLLAIRSRSGIM